MKPELNDGAMSLFSWKAGQKPNIGMLFLGGCCTCWIAYYVQIYNLYKELNRFFPKYDISNALIKAIFPIWYWLTFEADLNNLAKEVDVQLPPPKFPAIVCLCCGFLGPVLLADQMERANILFKAVAEKAE